MDPQRELLLQFVLMAATFVVIEIIMELCLASLAQRIRPWLQRVGQRSTKSVEGCSLPLVWLCISGTKAKSNVATRKPWLTNLVNLIFLYKQK